MRDLVVKLMTGPELPERVAQAFSVAATAVAAGGNVSMWLAGDAVAFAQPGRAESVVLAHATPLAELRDAVLADGQLTVCTQCARRRDLTSSDFLPGVRVAGAATFVAEVLATDSQALTY
jgi:predicted peroxiredoxin